MLILLIILIAVNVLIKSYWISPVQVDGHSMEQTISDGDWLLMEKNKTPDYGDIVIIHMDGQTNYIKRVIALGGDVVKTENGVIYLKKNGEHDFTLLNEPYAYYDGATGTYKNGEDFIVEVGYGEVFFLGDNRNKSTDSRVKGTRSVSDVLGVVPEWALKYRKMYEWYYNFIYHVNAAIFKNNCGA